MVRPALRLRLVPLARIPGAPPLPDLLWLIKGFGGAQIAAEAKGQDHVLGQRELLGIYARIRGEIGEGRHAGAPEGYDGALGQDTRTEADRLAIAFASLMDLVTRFRIQIGVTRFRLDTPLEERHLWNLRSTTGATSGNLSAPETACHVALDLLGGSITNSATTKPTFRRTVSASAKNKLHQ